MWNEVSFLHQMVHTFMHVLSQKISPPDVANSYLLSCAQFIMQNEHMHIQYLIEQAHHCENELSGSLASPCNFALLLFFPCFFLLFQSKKKKLSG